MKAENDNKRTKRKEIQFSEAEYAVVEQKANAARLSVAAFIREAALGKETYTLDDLFSALNKSVWSELSSGKSPDVYRRSLQNLYVERLLSLLPSGTASAGSGMEAVARVQYELRTLQGRLERVSAAELAVKAHYQYLAKRIKEKLDPK